MKEYVQVFSCNWKDMGVISLALFLESFEIVIFNGRSSDLLRLSNAFPSFRTVA